MENPRHLSGSRIRPGTVIERSQIKFVIFKMQEDVNGVLAWMINTSACKQPSNVSTLRCKMNRWKAPLIANIPWAQSPFLPRRAVIATAVPRLSSLGVTGARAGVGPNVTGPGRGQSTGAGSHCPGDLVSHGCRGERDVLSSAGPHTGLGFGDCGEVQDPSLNGIPPALSWPGRGREMQGRSPLRYCKYVCVCG